jgi:hypothetical protein
VPRRIKIVVSLKLHAMNGTLSTSNLFAGRLVYIADFSI